MPVRLAAVLGAMLALCVALPAQAQNTRETQRKLDQARRELKDVAAERRKVETERGAATRKLRDVDERVGVSTRALKQSEARLQQQQTELAALKVRRDALDKTLGAKREELARLLRAAYTVGSDAPLKLMLSQDRVADGNRLLAYHGYLQRDRAARIVALRKELAGLTEIEQRIARTTTELEATRKQQRTELAQLARDRKDRSTAVAELDKTYRDKRAREQALGRDVKGLQNVLAKLRAAARRAEAERKAAERSKAREERRTASRASTGGTSRAGQRPARPTIANAQPIRVGGLGWPLAGTLITPYGGTLPDGRRSEGVLIGAASGTPVQAVANGKVVFAEWMSGYGLLCIVDHGDGTMSLYANNDGLLRDVGTDVRRGEAVASVGNSGGQGRPALYFELRRNGQPVNPGTWLQKR